MSEGGTVLKQAENELLTRVGPGTAMGAVMRRYWIPVLLREEMPDPDGDPVRVRLLGEDLVAFRDSTGAVGLLGAFCPHRGAPLFFGRNERSGLRCMYHGWKFTVDGRCTDMPNVPPAIQGPDPAHELPLRGASRHGLGLPGTRTARPAVPGHGLDRSPAGPRGGVGAAAAVQLRPGHGRRLRPVPHLVPAQLAGCVPPVRGAGGRRRPGHGAQPGRRRGADA